MQIAGGKSATEVAQSGLLKVLRKLGIARQKARSYVHSPDVLYAEKLAYMEQVISECAKSEGGKVAVFMDELTYYNTPSPVADYAPKKNSQKPKELLVRKEFIALQVV